MVNKTVLYGMPTNKYKGSAFEKHNFEVPTEIMDLASGYYRMLKPSGERLIKFVVDALANHT